MRKLMIALMLILSVQITNAQAWSSYELPATATSVAFHGNQILLTTWEQLLVTNLPLPENGVLTFQNVEIPGFGPLYKVASMGNTLYLLRGTTLYSQTNNVWVEERTEVTNFSVSSDVYHGISAWNNDKVFLKRDANWEKLEITNVASVALDLHTVIIVRNNEVLIGPDLASATHIFTIDDMEVSHVSYCYTTKEYCVVGNVVGDLASWYQSSKNQVYKYTHILTEGYFESATPYKEDYFIAGHLSGKGVILNASNLTEMYFFPAAIRQLVTSPQGEALAAVDYYNSLYVMGNPGGTSLGVRHNDFSGHGTPTIVKGNCLEHTANVAGQLDLSDISGRLVSSFTVAAGKNIIPLHKLQPGVYILSSGEKILIR